MDGLALGTVFSVNAKRILDGWNDPILLIRSSKEISPHQRSFLDTPNERVLAQDTSEAERYSHVDYFFDPDTVVLPLCKTSRNRREDIMLGRHATNDICLAEPTLSKLHGWFIPPTKTPLGVLGSWTFVDNGSTNGTSINRHKILPHRPALVRYGDEMVLGDIHILFLSKESIFDLIEYMRNEDNKTKRITRLGAF